MGRGPQGKSHSLGYPNPVGGLAALLPYHVLGSESLGLVYTQVGGTARGRGSWRQDCVCVSDTARHRCWCPDKIAHAGRGDITCISGHNVLGAFLHHAGFTCTRLLEIDLRRHCGNWLRSQSSDVT